MTAERLSLVIGVDPGKTGAIAFVDTDGHLVDVVDMPDATGAALGARLADEVAAHAPHDVVAAWVEQVGPMPKQGVRSVWTFGANYGACLGTLGALRVPVRHVTPATWKKPLRLSRDKGASLQRAIEAWPADAHRFARKKDEGRAEAALIALYGIRYGDAPA